MELEDFRKDFLEAARATAASERHFSRAAFVLEAARRLADAEEISDFETCHHDGIGSRRRRLCVDGYAMDEADGSFRLVIADHRDTDDAETLTQSEAETAFGQLRAFIEDSLNEELQGRIEESSPGYGLASLLRQHLSSSTRFRLYLLTDALLSSRVKDLPQGELHGLPVEYHIWDIARFHRAYESTVGLDELDVDFTEFVQDGLPCLEAGQTGSDYKAYLCVIPGKALAEIYDRFGSRLLEGNVRSFLTVRGKVNKGIQATLRAEPAMFFAYNNGIATTATDAEVIESDSGLRIVRASNLQIVNGGQTTASLSLSRRKDGADLEDVHVPMKLSVVPPQDPDRMNEMIQRISRYANSQNKVSDADFFSNHPFHRRLETHSRRVWAPAVGGAQHETRWFYERARGQYLNERSRLAPAERRKFESQNPRAQVITKTDLAKFENSWSQLPYVVSTGAQKNFLRFAEVIGQRWNRNDAEFSEGYFRETVAKAILFRHTEKLVSAQPWYQGGYRANIVAYTIAKLSEMIESQARGRVMDFRTIWSRQAVSDVLDTQLGLVAREVFEMIVHPEGGFQNVTEWCKKELCWQRARSLRLSLLPGLVEELVDREIADEIRTADRGQQVVDAGIDAQTTVVGLGGEFFRQLQEWARGRAVLSPAEKQDLTQATRIPARVPPSFVCVRLLRIVRRLESEGFRLGC
jgi:hypothetical protein